MRSIALVIVALQLGWMHPAFAQGRPEGTPPIAEMLSLFAKNRCAEVRDPAEQLFCGDPELNSVGVRLNSAVENRLSRIADRRLAVEENVEWIRNRNSSCGIFGRQAVQPANFQHVKTCLLKVTNDRIAILADANFDCLATNTTAGLLICSDPALVNADKELNGLFVGLIARMRDDEAKGALAEYARSTGPATGCAISTKGQCAARRIVGRRPCLADYIEQKAAEFAAVRGDPEAGVRA